MTRYSSSVLSFTCNILRHCILPALLLVAAGPVRAQGDTLAALLPDTLQTADIVAAVPFMPGDAPCDSLWNAANRFYQQGEWKNALTLYSRLEESGLSAAALYYNMGNAFFRSNDIKHAILYYCRAQRLAPRDEDIAYNLALANTYTTDKIEAVDELFLLVWLRQLGNLQSLPQWTRWSMVCLALALAAAIVFLLAGRATLKYLSFWGVCLFLLLAAGSFAGAFYQYKTVTSQREAIVFSASVTVKSSPDANGNSLFVVHEGTRVHLEDRVGGWCEIRLEDGNKGWMPLSDLEII